MGCPRDQAGTPWPSRGLAMWPSRPCWRRQEKSPNTPFGGGQEREKTSIESSGCTYAPADSVAYSEAPYCLRAWSTQGLRGATLTAQKYQTPSEPDLNGTRTTARWMLLDDTRATFALTPKYRKRTVANAIYYSCRDISSGHGIRQRSIPIDPTKSPTTTRPDGSGHCKQFVLDPY